jgi:predicted acetylornithine/succinylornithine family transaminase
MTATVQLAAPPQEGALLPIYRRVPLEIVRGEGVYVYDPEGRAYLDFVSGIAVNALGYNDDGIRGAIESALSSGVVHASNLYHTGPARALASALAERSFASNVFFCNSGAEANEGAFKFARRWALSHGGAGKHELIALRGSFHGRLFASLAATDRPGYRAPFRPLAGGVGIVERDLGALDIALNAETVAAVIVEPVQGEGGVRVLDAEFLRGLRDMTHARDIALIFDEVQCGLGRTGYLFAYQRYGVEPDLLTLAKPLAGGLPMGAVLLNEQIASAIRPGDHATTFGGGPLVASVALHVLDRVSDATFLSGVRERGLWMGHELRAIGTRTGRVRAVRGTGYIWGIDVTMPASEIVTAALEEGLLVCVAGEHTVRLLPPLVATRDELGQGLAILERVLS